MVNLGKYKNYINWFIDKVKGVDGILNNSEEKVLAYWTSQVNFISYYEIRRKLIENSN